MTDAHNTARHFDPFAEVIAAGDSSSADLFAVVADILSDRAGAKLVTVTSVDPHDQSYERLYSSMPEIYPVSGRKPANRTRWNEQVMQRLQTFVVNDYDGLSEVMPDHAKIRSIGCESLVNVPLVLFGRVIGTLNCLAGSGNFTETRVRLCKEMRLPVMLGLLARERLRS